LSNSLPDHQVSVTLRASTQLSARGEQGPATGSGATPPAHVGHDDDDWLTARTLAVGGLAVLLGTGWLLERRQRLVQRTKRFADAVPAEPPQQAETPTTTVTTVPVVVVPAEPAQQAEMPAGEPVDAMAQVAAQLQEQPAAIPPQQSFPAPLERTHRGSLLIGVASKKRLIKGLMWVRTVAGAAAILAAIAIVVFWSIETTDMRAGDTGLTAPLLVLLLAGWAASWGAGQLANHLHRAFFGRVHPKFDN
jgi:hypothetical protein